MRHGIMREFESEWPRAREDFLWLPFGEAQESPDHCENYTDVVANRRRIGKLLPAV